MDQWPTPDESIDPLLIFRKRPDQSAAVTVTTGQKIAVALCLLVLVAALALDWVTTLVVINGAAIVFYLVHISYKFYLVWLSLGRGVEVSPSAAALTAIPDSELPKYTIQVPLYRETEVLARLVKGLSAMDYPADKLDIQLLLEVDDDETIEAARAMDLPPQFRCVVVPDGQPKAKPRACNYGLQISDADLLVIYDAEDRPEPDQLRKAAVAFRGLPDDLVCLQARLNYYNQRQNILTRWFTQEYSVWFDLFLPGLTVSGAPIPLGGTSNHFRVPVLKALMGWDPFNVTEDCDLGVRLHAHGYRSAMLDSTTWEEANSAGMNWIRQRSRWVKGYIQTYLVHMRSPLGLLKSLGARGFFGFQMTVGGSILCFLLNPIYWLMTALWFLTHASIISSMFPPLIFGLGLVCLFLGNFSFIYLSVAGCMQRGYHDLVKYCILTPIYWLMMSIGAYKGAFQLITRPHYWEKTQHGLFEEPEDV
ncbi:MAG TPA: glycosyltransferase [Armatimonadota bacterium]|nr:glycosyltransferase [Armatimonadota bacterium]